MKYFTLAEDFEELQKSTSKQKRRIFIFLVVLIIIPLMRGFGIITFEYYKANFHGNHTAVKESLVFNDNYSSFVNNKKNSTLETADEISHWNLGFSFKLSNSFSGDKKKQVTENEKDYLENLIKEKIAGESLLSEQFKSVAVSVKKFDMSGLYWLPLIKNGNTSYRITIKNEFLKDNYSVDFSGEFDLEVYGFCSVSNLKKTVAEKISNVVVKSVKEDYKK